MFRNRKKKEVTSLESGKNEGTPALSPFQIKLNEINQNRRDEKERENKEECEKLGLKTRQNTMSTHDYIIYLVSGRFI